jgi:hypothetical protein
MERALFGALTGEATIIRSSEEALDVKTLDPEIRWVVTVGEANITGLPQALITGPVYSFYSLKSDNSLTPRSNEFASMTPLCTDPANTGWSCGGDTLVSFTSPVPAFGEIDLIFDVSDQTAASELEFVLGESVLTGTFPKGVYSLTLTFTNASAESELIIRSKGAVDSGASQEVKLVRIVSANINR